VRLRRLLMVLGLASLAVVPCRAGQAAEDPFPSIATAYLLKVQAQTLWAHAARTRLPPASLTKIMTALLVLERYRPEAVVTVSRPAAAASGSRLGLRRGDRMRVADLLAAALIRSANDACRALAEWRAGSEARFVALMNQRARALKLLDTRFANACGHDAPGHYSTAEDLALLTETALRFPVFAELVGTAAAVLRTADGGREFAIENTNALLGRLPGALGVKSGYTRRAGRCLVALAERDGVRVLLVLLNASNRWWDAHQMVERAFSLRSPHV
jgi:D-alanyl-D-alanine carboxypeptidase (penicillin-binding protein 5/6)